MEKEVFVFFGIIGSGKGTQIELLSKFLKERDLKTLYIGTGEEYRSLLKTGNYTAKILIESLNKGELQPDFFTNSVVINRIVNNFEKDTVLIFDGYPRTIVQVNFLEEILRFYKLGKVHIIHIEISKGEAMQRNLLRGREDDTESSILKRFEEYEKNVLPSILYLKNKEEYSFHTVNGEQSIEDVHKDIIKFLNLI